ncbi:type I polyketide synthase, partial [Streptomyces sp. NPDC050625]|uniref:type I polyketide synthase n=1 Tax=Streptomyces sp. NPDC050625 TaxID=3154629 RepID=UPI00341D088C
GPVWDAAGTVLVTGASGALAGVVARHLVVVRGVRRVLLVSRSGAGVEELLGELVALGAEDVSFAACDVADREGMAAVLGGVPAEYPLRGVVHAAGVLDDGVLGGLSGERLAGVLRPKVDGALVLDELTRGLDLSAFVLFSSVAGVVGTAGQAAYAAANAFMDALVARRRSEGFVGTSLAWGLWAAGMGGGLQDRDLERVARMGFVPMPDAEALDLFDAAVELGRACVVPARLDMAALRERAGRGELPVVLRGLVRASRRAAVRGQESSGLVQRLLGMSGSDRERFLVDLVGGEVAVVLGHVSPGTIDASRAFQAMGFDSLTALELRQRVQNATGVRMPATLVFDYPTPQALAGYLLREVLGTEAGGVPAEIVPVVPVDEPVAIVGMACRYPGGIASPEDLWRLVAEGG